MLSVLSLRKIVHSTSLRATGSLIVFARSSACDDLPLRAAVTASLRAAISAAEIGSLEATANREARGAGAGVAAAVLGLASVFAGVPPGRGLGSGTPTAESACIGDRSIAAARPVSNRVGVCMIKVSSPSSATCILIRLIRLTKS